MPCVFKSKLSEGCQFDVPEEQLIQRSGTCIFHLPEWGMVEDATNKNRWSDDQIKEFENLILERIREAAAHSNRADFTGVIFPPGINFEGEEFPEVSFNEAKFLGVTSFKGAKFIGNVTFWWVMFVDHASFDRVQFKDNALFYNSGFAESVSFDQTSFSGVANFDEVKFGFMTSFEEVTFGGRASFKETQFQRGTFRSAAFLDIVDFNSAGFTQSCLFGAAKFEKQVDFSCKPNYNCNLGLVEFEEAIFLNDISFVNRHFLNTTNFRGCSFAKAPKFHHCLLHQDTDFEGSKFDDKSESAARAYRTLKLAMENVRAHREEAMFYALEQKSLRQNKRIGALIRLFSWFYEMTSDYGQSIARPILTIVLVIFLFAGIYGYVASPFIHLAASVDWKVIGNGLLFSVEQLVSPFHIWKQEHLPIWASQNLALIKVLTTVESLLGLAAFALLLLSVRWRFKRG